MISRSFGSCMIIERILTPVEIEVGFDMTTVRDDVHALSNEQVQDFMAGKDVKAREYVDLARSQLWDMVLEEQFFEKPATTPLQPQIPDPLEGYTPHLGLQFIDERLAAGTDLARILEPDRVEAREHITDELPLLMAPTPVKPKTRIIRIEPPTYDDLEAAVAEETQPLTPVIPRIVGKIKRENNPLYKPRIVRIEPPAYQGLEAAVAEPLPIPHIVRVLGDNYTAKSPATVTPPRKRKRWRGLGAAAAAIILAATTGVASYMAPKASSMEIEDTVTPPRAEIGYIYVPEREDFLKDDTRELTGCFYTVQPGDGYARVGERALGNSEAGRRLKEIYAGKQLHPGEQIDVCPTEMKIGVGTRMYNAARRFASTFGGNTKDVLEATQNANPERDLSRMVVGETLRLPDTVQTSLAKMYSRTRA
jgi:hypothetical protein